LGNLAEVLGLPTTNNNSFANIAGLKKGFFAGVNYVGIAG
jgi:hypothetical protein